MKNVDVFAPKNEGNALVKGSAYYNKYNLLLQ